MVLDDLVPVFSSVSWLFTLRQKAEGSKNQGVILFVHGMFTGAWCFLPWMHHFDAEGYNVYVLDLSGHGAHLADLNQANLSLYVRNIEEVFSILRTCGGGSSDKVILVGHSMGGLLAQIWASKHPGTVAKLVLVTSAPPAGIRLRWYLLSRIWRYIPALVNGRAFRGHPEDLRYLMLNGEYEGGEGGRQRVLDLLGQESGIAALQIALWDPVVWIKNPFPGPTLVVAGEKDRMCPVSMQQQVACKHHATLMRVDTAHMPMLEQNRLQVSGDITTWLKSSVYE